MKKLLIIMSLFVSTGVAGQCLQTAPYIETFDNDTTPSCWQNPVNIVFNTPMYWYSANNTSSNPASFRPAGLANNIGDHTGNGGYYMYTYRGWNRVISMTTPSIDVSPLTTPALTFWMFAHTNSTQSNSLAIDVYDGAWTQAVATLSFSSPRWNYQVIDLSTYAGDTIKVRFRRLNTVNGNQDVLVDDVALTEWPTCLPPRNVLIDSVTATEAFLNIPDTTNNRWEYEYDTAGFSRGSGLRDTTSQNSFSLTGLTPNTAYDVYLRHRCSATDSSVWIKQSFTTRCPVFTAPFTETFDQTSTPPCWDNFSSVMVNFFVGFSTAEDYTNNGGASAHWDFRYRFPIVHLETPQVDISGLNQPYLSLYRKAYEPATIFQKLEGFVTAEVFDGTNWISLDSFQLNDPHWHFNYVDLAPFNVPDTTRFRLSFKSNGKNTTDDYVDNFSIGEKPACLPTDSFFVNNLKINAASLKFTGTANRQVEWGSRGFLRGSGKVVHTATTSASLTGAKPNTWYTAYYRDSCSAGYGEWSEPVHFLTPCPTVWQAPFRESFNHLPMGDTTFDSSCWTSHEVGQTQWVADVWTLSGSTGPEVRHDGNFVFTEASGGDSTDISYLESPRVDLSPTQNPFLSFYYHMYGSTMGNLCLEINTGAGWQALDTCLAGAQQVSGTSPWKRKLISLAGYAQSTIQIRFKGERGTNANSDMAIDDVWFMDSCTAALPVASFGFNLDSVNSSEAFVSFNSTASGASSARWEFGDGSSDTGSAVTHAYQANGTYTVWQFVENPCGKRDSTTAIVNVNGIGTPELGMNLEPQIFPNPAQEQIIVDQLLSQTLLTIYDVQGRKVYAPTLHHKRAHIDISNLTEGVYFIQLQRGGAVFMKKLVVQR